MNLSTDHEYAHFVAQYPVEFVLFATKVCAYLTDEHRKLLRDTVEATRWHRPHEEYITRKTIKRRMQELVSLNSRKCPRCAGLGEERDHFQDWCFDRNRTDVPCKVCSSIRLVWYMTEEPVTNDPPKDLEHENQIMALCRCCSWRDWAVMTKEKLI